MKKSPFWGHLIKIIIFCCIWGAVAKLYDSNRGLKMSDPNESTFERYFVFAAWMWDAENAEKYVTESKKLDKELFPPDENFDYYDNQMFRVTQKGASTIIVAFKHAAIYTLQYILLRLILVFYAAIGQKGVLKFPKPDLRNVNWINLLACFVMPLLIILVAFFGPKILYPIIMVGVSLCIFGYFSFVGFLALGIAIVLSGIIALLLAMLLSVISLGMIILIPLLSRYLSIVFTGDILYTFGFFENPVGDEENGSIMLKTLLFRIPAYVYSYLMLCFKLNLPDVIYYPLTYAPFAMILYYTSNRILCHEGGERIGTVDDLGKSSKNPRLFNCRDESVSYPIKLLKKHR